jgi:hypothetical protein
MGSMSSRAGTETRSSDSSLTSSLSGISDVCPNLPPQQLADHQAQISGKI